MENTRLTSMSLPELTLIVGTRAILGAGIALLLADRITPEQRRAAGWSLFTMGAFMSIPLAFEIFGERAPKVEQTPSIVPRAAA